MKMKKMSIHLLLGKDYVVVIEAVKTKKDIQENFKGFL